MRSVRQSVSWICLLRVDNIFQQTKAVHCAYRLGPFLRRQKLYIAYSYYGTLTLLFSVLIRLFSSPDMYWLEFYRQHIKSQLIYLYSTGTSKNLYRFTNYFPILHWWASLTSQVISDSHIGQELERYIRGTSSIFPLSTMWELTSF